MEKEKEIFKSPEKEPQHNEVVIDFLRHGKTEYTEKGRDLTPEGEEQIRKGAEGIVEKIDPEKEIIVLWSSPAVRAQGSEEIIKELLNERRIKAYKDSEINTMRNFDQRDKEFMEKFWQEAEKKGISPETLYTQKGQDKSDKFETQEEVRERTERVFNWIGYLTERANLQSKKLHIIGVSHFEFLNPVIEDVFGYKIKEKDFVKYGEGIRVNFDYNPTDKEMQISAEFRGEKKDNITFDKKKRKFIVKNK